MLFWIYILIAVYLTVVVLIEHFNEKDWRKQIAYAMLLMPFVLRIFLIK